MSTPDVSIVLCTRNRAAMLRNALESLLALEAADFTYEIVVVDNGSTDDTPAVAAAAQCKHITVRHVVERRPGVAFARNCGVSAARGEWIAFFDDDQLADRRWLAELLDMAQLKQSRCIGGAVLLRLPEEGAHRKLSPVCRMLLGETVDMNDVRRYSATVTPGTGNLIVHRSVFEECGHFDESLNVRGEDTNLFMRIHNRGIPSWYTPRAIVLHIIPPERLCDEYLRKLARLTSVGMADNDRNHWGKTAFPLVWLARCGQVVVSLFPRVVWSALRRDQEQVLGNRCRLVIAGRYLADGLKLMARGLVPRCGFGISPRLTQPLSKEVTR